MIPPQEGVPIPNAGISLIDQLATRHPELRGSGLFLVLDWMLDENALADYRNDYDRRMGVESLTNPQDFAIAWSLLFHAASAAIDVGYFNLRDPDRRDGLYRNEDKEQLSLLTLDFLQSVSGTGIAPITADVITKLIQTQRSFGEPEAFGSLKGSPIVDTEGQPIPIFDVFWNVDGRPLTREEAQTIRGDLKRIVQVTCSVEDYVRQRAKQADSPPGVALYFPDHRFAQGFVYRIGWQPKTAVQQTEDYARIGLKSIQIDILDVLTNHWDISFRKYYKSQGLPVPPIHFEYPYDKGTDSPPMPMDLDFESQTYLHFTGPSYAELDSLCQRLFWDWQKGKVGIEEIITALEAQKKEMSRWLAEKDMVGMNIFHLWAIALRNANDRDWVKRRGALDPDMYQHYETDAYAAHASERDQFAALIAEAMTEPNVFKALPPEVQEIIPFFTGGY